MGGEQASVLVRMVFAGWFEIMKQIKSQRDVDRSNSQMKQKEDKTSRRMLRMMMGSQGTMKGAFTGWRDLVKEEANHRKMVEMQKQMKAKGVEGMKRMLGNLLTTQASALMRATFVGWAEIYGNAKALQMREQYGSMKSKGAESSRRMLGMLLGSQNGALLKACFSVWHELITKLRQERELEQLQASMKSKGFEKRSAC